MNACKLRDPEITCIAIIAAGAILYAMNVHLFGFLMIVAGIVLLFTN